MICGYNFIIYICHVTYIQIYINNQGNIIIYINIIIDPNNQGNEKYIHGEKLFIFAWLTDGKCWDWRDNGNICKGPNALQLGTIIWRNHQV